MLAIAAQGYVPSAAISPIEAAARVGASPRQPAPISQVLPRAAVPGAEAAAPGLRGGQTLSEGTATSLFRLLLEEEANERNQANGAQDAGEGAEGGGESGSEAEARGPDGLTSAEREEVRELKQRDTEVRAHEQAHVTAGGPYAGAPRYETVRGPDGRSYAVGGEVDIDVSPIQGNPEATIRKMEIVKRAALAPPDPSPQDRAVAAQAEAIEAQARAEKSRLEKEEREERDQRSDERALQSGGGVAEAGGGRSITDLVEAYRIAGARATGSVQGYGVEALQPVRQVA